MRRIGKYEILGLLGRGGMGRVYKVRLPVAGRMLALKLLAPDETLTAILGETEVRRMFTEEAALIGGLRHPRVAAVTDFDHDARGRPFYCMEFFCRNLGVILGESYRAEEPARALPVETAARLALETLDGVALLHAKGLLHRDLKPFNVMLDDEEHAKLIDFGLSARRGERRATPGGLAIGTPFYTAPEQETDPDSATERSDLFSVGVICWRMLTGRLPGERADERRKPSSLAPELFHAFDEFLPRAVHPEPERRFSSAEDMQMALSDALDDWRAAMRGACSLAEEEPLRADAANARPRETPRKVAASEASQAFPLGSLWRPLPGPIPELKLLRRDGARLVVDAANGLCWQQGGSPQLLTRFEAEEYCAKLNETRFAGRSGWRLPTVEELCLIIRRGDGADAYCADPLFDHRQKRLWSADAKSGRASWCADAVLGHVTHMDNDCLAHVRAVCRTDGPA